MKILFICGSFEPGKDGVGDYVRQLSLSLVECGHEIAICALNDKFKVGINYEVIEAAGDSIRILRCSNLSTNQEKFGSLSKWMLEFNPEWISLQYVPFSFHKKGLNFNLAKRLKRLTGDRKWHIMFHEIAVGMGENSTFKEIAWGFVQKHLAKSLLVALKPAVVNTHVVIYQKLLESFGITVTILPLFSNIPVSYPDLVVKKLERKFEVDNSIELVVFAAVQPGAPIRQLAVEAKKYELENGVKIKLVLIGRSGSEQVSWDKAWKSEGLESVILGEKNPDEISKLLAAGRFGLFSTPLSVAGKSGAVAAMREHRINLMCVARNWKARGINEESNFYDIIEYNAGNLGNFLVSTPDFSFIPTTSVVAQQFIFELRKK